MAKKKASPSLEPVKRPVSATPVSIGCLALLGFLSTLAYGLSQFWQPYAIMWVCSLSIFLPVVGYEILSAHSTFNTRPENIDEHDYRVNVKRIGLIVTIAIWAGVAWLFPYYRNPGIQLWEMLTYPITLLIQRSHTDIPEIWSYVACITVLYLINTYIAYVDLRVKQPKDGLFCMGAWVIRKTKDIDYAVLKQYFLQWTVKIFFLPLMLMWLHGNILNLAGQPWHSIYQLYTNPIFPMQYLIFQYWEIIKTLFYTIDLAFAMVGYACTLKLLDTHIRSAEPTLFGWTVCLACYGPFHDATNGFTQLDDNINFVRIWGNHPTLCLVWIGMVLAFLGAYAFTTVQFGIRFSNLTHRGILTNGFYSLSRHPAYLLKNTMWWLLLIPLASTLAWPDLCRNAIWLAMWNTMYYYRAKTEEAHLGQDPAYKQYSDWIDQHGLIARTRRLLTYSIARAPAKT